MHKTVNLTTSYSLFNFSIVEANLEYVITKEFAEEQNLCELWKNAQNTRVNERTNLQERKHMNKALNTNLTPHINH